MTTEYGELIKQGIQDLNTKGFAHLPAILSKVECEHLQNIYQHDIYRNTINMERYRFGKGEYKYFNYPLPAIIQNLRAEFYESLAPLANEWMRLIGAELKYPSGHSEFIEECREAGQVRPTPLILKYTEGGYNTLHQDLYGDIYFPFQVVIVLTNPSIDHTGGELVLLEQIPRAQSKAEVIAPSQGDAIIFTTNFRPIKGTRGYFKAKMKHGVSPIRSGVRMALGIIFHDAS